MYQVDAEKDPDFFQLGYGLFFNLYPYLTSEMTGNNE
jgi:hypothetical protein